MNVLAKTLFPVVCVALIITAISLVWLPDSLSGSQRFELEEILILGLVFVVLAAWLGVELYVRAPLRSLLSSQAELLAHGDAAPTPTDEIAGLRQTLASLRDRLLDDRRRIQSQTEEIESVRQTLHESEERYDLAMRIASEGIWEWDIGTDAMDLSPRWKAMLGYAPEQLDNTLQAWKNRIYAADRHAVEAALMAHVEGKTPRFESEHRVLHRDNSQRWVLSRATAIRHANGRAYRMIGLDADITPFKHMEETLLRVAEGASAETGDAFFRSLVRNLSEALGVSIAFITECVDVPPQRVRTLAFWDRGRFRPDFEYDLTGTPCESVIKHAKAQHFVKDVAKIFPKDVAISGLESYHGIPITDVNGKVLGHLAFFDAKQTPETATLNSIYRIFVARAAAEMRRKQTQKIVNELTNGLATVRGRACFESLARSFAKVTGADEAMVAHCTDTTKTRLRSLGWWRGDRFENPIEFDIEGTPCAEPVVSGHVHAIEGGVSARFSSPMWHGRESFLGVPCIDTNGHVVGLLFCCSAKPMLAGPPEETILNVFAERSARELELEQVRETLHDLSERVSPLRGEEYFRELVRSVALVLGVREAFVTECANFPTTRMRRLAHWKNKAFVEAKDYDLPGAPCEEVIQSGRELYCPVGAGERWPREKPFGWESYIGLACRDRDQRIIGHIAIVDEKPMSEEQPEWSILKLIAERTAIELERRALPLPVHPSAVAQS